MAALVATMTISSRMMKITLQLRISLRGTMMMRLCKTSLTKSMRMFRPKLKKNLRRQPQLLMWKKYKRWTSSKKSHLSK